MSTPLFKAVSVALTSGGSPACQPLIPAESTEMTFPSPACSTFCLNTPSAVGERHIFPVQTNKTLYISLSDHKNVNKKIKVRFLFYLLLFICFFVPFYGIK